MSALPTPSRFMGAPASGAKAASFGLRAESNKRPLVLRPEAPGAAATAPPRRIQTQPRLARRPAPPPPSMLVRSLKAVLLVAVAGGSALGVVKVKDLVEGSDALPLGSVVVVARSGQLSAQRELEVKAYAELSEGEPFFGIDTDAVEERIERHPFVREAVVRRLPPDTIEIDVQERTARLALSTPQGLYLLDEDGDVMKRARPGDDVDVPVLSGVVLDASSDAESAKLSRALGLVGAVAKAGLGARLSEIVGLPATGFELVFVDGARVRVGDNDFDAKLQRLLATEQRLAAHGRHFSFMWLDDARHPERVAVRLRSSTETSSTGG